MKKWIGALLTLLAWCSQVSAVEESSWPDRVRVLLVEDTRDAYVEVKGKYQVVDPRTGHKLSGGGGGKCYRVFPQYNGLAWGEQYPGIYQVAVLPKRSDTTVLVNGIEYCGALYIYQIGSRISIVNEVPVEEYTKQMMATRAPATMADEAAAALAVAMRSQVYSKMIRAKSAHWHIRASDEGYLGFGVERHNPVYDAAVDRTRDMVLVASELGGAPVPAQFTGHCAGKTADHGVFFRQSVGSCLRGVDAPLAARSREEAAWNFRVTRDELAHIAGLSSLSGVNLYVDNFSKKVYAMRFYDGVEFQDVDFAALQKALGCNRLCSSDFTVEVCGSEVEFQGRGEGPGVGLCLYSADELAQRGQDAKMILSSFFPHAQLQLAPVQGARVAKSESKAATRAIDPNAQMARPVSRQLFTSGRRA